MDLLMNGLLMAATLFAGGYCWVLGRRVQDLKSLDRGLGGSIVTLTRQIELARTTLDEARGASKETRADLDRLIGKADAAANQLKLLIAAAPIYPQPPRTPQPAPVPAAPAPAPAPTLAAPAAPAAPLAPEWPPVARAAAPLRPLTLPEMPVADAAASAEPPVERPAVPAPAAPGVPAMNLAEVPKPRALAPVENPLRRAKGPAKGAGPGHAAGASDDAGHSEDAILEALTALAGGGR